VALSVILAPLAGEAQRGTREELERV